MVLRKAAEVVVDPKLFPLVLYKKILRLHYGLPSEVRFIGDQYVKAEFKAHKDVTNSQFLDNFYKEWLSYSTVLAKQLSNKGIASRELGKDLTSFEDFNEEQLRQLYDLKLESEEAKNK